MGGIDVRCWFELLERRVLCSVTSDALATAPTVIDDPPPNVVLPPPLTGTNLPASSTTTLQYIGANTGGYGPVAIAADGTVWSTNGTGLIRTTPDGVSTVFQDPDGDSIYGITIGGDGNVWVTENGTSSVAQPVGVIARVDANGNFTDFTIPPDGIGSDTPGATAYVPISIATGANGDVYFDLSDLTTDNKLIQVAPDGTMTFFNLPDGSQRSGLVEASDGAIWFTGSEGAGLPDYLGRFTPDGGVQQFVFPLQQGYQPPGPLWPDVQPGFSGLAAGANGSVWFANEFGGLVGNITTQGNITEYQTGLADSFGISQMSITMAQDGSLWISDNGLENMNVQGATPTFTPVANVGGGSLATAADGDIYMNVAGTGLAKLVNTAPAPVVPPPSTPVVPPPTAPPPVSPAPVTADSVPPNVVLSAPITGPRYVAQGSTTVTYVGSYSDPKFLGDDGIAVSSDGTMWPEHGDTQLIRTTPDGTSTIFSDPDGYAISGITIGGDGNVWVTENAPSPVGQWEGVIARVDANGNFTDFWIPPDGTGTDTPGASAYMPLNIVTGANGDVYFNLNDATPDNKIVQVAPDGTMTFFAVPDGSQGGVLTATSDGAIWFTGSEGPGLSDFIGRLAPDGSVQQFVFPVQTPVEIAGSQLVQPGFSALTPGPDGGVWFANSYGGLVGNITAQGTVTEYQTPLADQYNNSQMSLATGPDGSLWMSPKTGGIVNMSLQSGTPIFTALSTFGGAIVAGPNGQIYYNTIDPFAQGYLVGEIVPSTAPVPYTGPIVVEPLSPPVTPPSGGGVVTPGGDETPSVSNKTFAAVAPPPAFASVFSHAPAIASQVDASPFSVLPIDSNSLLN
jgi:virginiamycin B lyase